MRTENRHSGWMRDSFSFVPKTHDHQNYPWTLVRWECKLRKGGENVFRRKSLEIGLVWMRHSNHIPGTHEYWQLRTAQDWPRSKQWVWNKQEALFFFKTRIYLHGNSLTWVLNKKNTSRLFRNVCFLSTDFTFPWLHSEVPWLPWW